jgi:uncharacterized protein with PIN domain
VKFIVDECTGDSVAKWLKISGFESYSVYAGNRGADDEWILEKAIKVILRLSRFSFFLVAACRAV